MPKPKEIAEISLLLWYLSLEKVKEIKKLALELKKQCRHDEPVDDSDEWTKKDLRQTADEVFRRLDKRRSLRMGGGSQRQGGILVFDPGAGELCWCSPDENSPQRCHFNYVAPDQPTRRHCSPADRKPYPSARFNRLCSSG